MNGWRGTATTVMAAALVLGTGCSSEPVVGALLPLSGEAARYGEAIESGARLALDQARERGELPEGFDIVWRDTASSGEQAAEELTGLIDEHRVKIVLGGVTTEEARAMLPILEEQRLVVVSPSASAPDLAGRSKHFYRLYPSDELEGSQAGTFLATELDKRREAKRTILYTAGTPYSEGIRTEFLQSYRDSEGGHVVAEVDLSSGEWQEASAAALEEHSPTAAFVIAYADNTSEVLHHLAEERFDGIRLTTSAFYSGGAIDELGDLAEGVFLVLPPFDRTSDEEPVRSFVDAYMDAYQRAPDVFAAHGFDAMRVILQVLRDAKPPETPEIRDALRSSISEFPGVTGAIQFNDFGDVTHYPKTFIVADGDAVSYDHFKETRTRQQRERLRKLQEEMRQLAASGGN